jgi:hypothetical protein
MPAAADRLLKRTQFACLAAALGVGLAGCAPTSLYAWGDYEASLSSRYLQEDLPRAELLLRNTIAGAERESRRVPPGVYADYGFLLYRRKDYEGAVRFFEKEKAAFPESAALMTRIVARVREQQRGQPAASPETGRP